MGIGGGPSKMKNEDRRGVVFGAGFLGTRIADELGFELPDINVLNTDATDSYLEKTKPSVVINCVGETGRPNIDWCEDHKEETLLANTAAPIILSSLCAKRGIYFIHLGTAAFYSSSEENPATEESIPNGINNFYSKSKFLAEETLKNLPGLQLRIHTPLDSVPGQRNLVDKLLTYPKLVEEKSSMTTVPYLIKTIKYFVENPREGVYNVVHPGTISPVEVMEMYQELVDPAHQFEKISTGELSGITKAKRPRTILSMEKLENEGVILPEIHEAVRESLINYKNHKLS